MYGYNYMRKWCVLLLEHWIYFLQKDLRHISCSCCYCFSCCHCSSSSDDDGGILQVLLLLLRLILKSAKITSPWPLSRSDLAGSTWFNHVHVTENWTVSQRCEPWLRFESCDGDLNCHRDLNPVTEIWALLHKFELCHGDLNPALEIWTLSRRCHGDLKPALEIWTLSRRLEPCHIGLNHVTTLSHKHKLCRGNISPVTQNWSMWQRS